MLLAGGDRIGAGVLAGPPHHGIGRGFKVGKEEIVGLLTALRRLFETRFRAQNYKCGSPIWN